jgi:hypothetical protein
MTREARRGYTKRNQAYLARLFVLIDCIAKILMQEEKEVTMDQ